MHGLPSRRLVGDLCRQLGVSDATFYAWKKQLAQPSHVGLGLSRTAGYRPSQRARKKIEELWGGAKCWLGFSRFRRRGLWIEWYNKQYWHSVLNYRTPCQVEQQQLSHSTQFVAA